MLAAGRTREPKEVVEARPYGRAGQLPGESEGRRKRRRKGEGPAERQPQEENEGTDKYQMLSDPPT